MKDKDKTNKQLINKLADCSKRLAEFKLSEAERKRTEKEHKELLDLIERAKQEWELAADSLSQVICLLDNQGHLLRANLAVERWNLGQVTDIKGLGMHKLFHPGCTDPGCYMETFWPPAWEKLTQGQSTDFEVEDSVLKRHLRIQPLPVAYKRRKNKVADAFAVVIIHDITERKRAEEALRESEEKYRMIFEKSPLGILYFNQNGEATDCNENFTEIIGAPKEKIIGFNMMKSLKDEKMRAAAAASLAGKSGHYEGDYLSVLGNKLTPLKADFGPILSNDGSVMGGVGVFEDITKRKQAEKAVRDREKFLEHILDSIQDGISILDKDMNIIRVNPSMEKWYSHAMPLVGKKCYEAYHSRSISCEVCPSRQTLETGKATYEVVPKRGPDGKVVGWMDLYSFPLFDTETNQLKGVIEYVRDITDRKKLEEKVKKKMNELEKFHKVVVGRELKMRELKKEITTLKTHIETLKARKFS